MEIQDIIKGCDKAFVMPSRGVGSRKNGREDSDDDNLLCP